MKFQASMAAVAAILGFGLVAAPMAQAAGIGFVPVRLGPVQGLRIGISNLADPQPAGSPPDPCRGTVTFYDATGAAVGAAAAFELLPGQSLHLAMPQNNAALLAAVVGGGAVSRRAVVRFAAAVNTTDAAVAPSACGAAYAGEEIYNTETGATQFMNPGVIRGFNPQPDPPGFVE